MIEIYTEMGSLFDERRGIITKVAREAGNTRFEWGRNFAQIYQRRRMDIFNQPELGITQEAYEARYEKRSLADFEDEKEVYFLPTNLIYNMFRLVRELEFGVGQMISAASFNVTVNLWPYQLTQSQADELASVMKGAVKFNYTLSFVFIEPEELTPKVLHKFGYVFKYDMLLSPRMKNYWENYIKAPDSGTKFIVPSILTSRELPEEMRREEPIDLITKMNFTQGGKITLVPVNKTIFDYKE
uniref:Neck protein n=1 Tax=Pantoea phage Survivor TaxID=3232176 RepID=A0AAU8KXV6_9CAUD